MDNTLPGRLRMAYDRCKLFPEQSRNPGGSVNVSGQAFVALIELRNLVPEIENALRELQNVKDAR